MDVINKMKEVAQSVPIPHILEKKDKEQPDEKKELNPDEVGDANGPQSPEAKSDPNKKEEKKKYERLRKGDYLVQVHLIEARDLKGR